MRRHRKRRSAGLHCYTVELRETEIAGLVRAGLLPEEKRADHEAIVQALYRFLDQSALNPCHAQRR